MRRGDFFFDKETKEEATAFGGAGKFWRKKSKAEKKKGVELSLRKKKVSRGEERPKGVGFAFVPSFFFFYIISRIEDIFIS